MTYVETVPLVLAGVRQEAALATFNAYIKSEIEIHQNVSSEEPDRLSLGLQCALSAQLAGVRSSKEFRDKFTKVVAEASINPCCQIKDILDNLEKLDPPTEVRALLLRDSSSQTILASILAMTDSRIRRLDSNLDDGSSLSDFIAMASQACSGDDMPPDTTLIMTEFRQLSRQACYFIGIRKSSLFLGAQASETCKASIAEVKVSPLFISAIEAFARSYSATVLVSTPLANMQKILIQYYGFKLETNRVRCVSKWIEVEGINTGEPLMSPCFVMNFPTENAAYLLIDKQEK